MRIFLDANILFSAAKSDGAVRQLVRLLSDAGHESWADAYVIEEARRNLSVKNPAAVAALEKLLKKIHVGGMYARDSAMESGFPLPEKNKPVLAAAVRCGCACLVTGDRTHFGNLYGKTIAGVTIHSPRSIAEAPLY